MRRKTRPSGVSSMAQHHLSDSTRLFGCALGSKKDEPARSGPIEMCEIRAARIIYELELSRSLCAHHFIMRVCCRCIPKLPAGRRAVAGSMHQGACISADFKLLTIEELGRPHTTDHFCVALAIYRGRVILASISAGSKENSQKGVDDASLVLHNLVSLLLMQRRRTKRYRVVGC